MMYPLITFNDNTEITHSEILKDGTVEVYVETPDKHDGFHHLKCYIPGYKIAEVNGYTDSEVAKYMKEIRKMAHLIIRFARGGGFENAPII